MARFLTYSNSTTKVPDKVPLMVYFTMLRGHDWNYMYAEGDTYKVSEVNQKNIENISKQSARHRCLFSSIKRNKIK